MTGMPASSACAAWRPGARLGVSAWAVPDAPAGGPAFRAGRHPGEWSVEAPGGVASPVRVQIPFRPDGTAALWHDGWLCGTPGQPPHTVVAAVAPGALFIRIDPPHEPRLFSIEREVEQREGLRLVAAGDGTVALAVDPERPSHWALACGDSADEAATRAAQVLASDLDAWADAGWARRQPLRNIPAGDSAPAALAAFEQLAGALRPAGGAMAFRWTDDGDGAFSVNDLPLLVSVWQSWDASVSADLLLAAFALAGEDGRVPSRAGPDGPVRGAPPAWPLLAQAAQAHLESHPDAGLATRLLPGALRHLAAWLTASDPSRRGVPTWPSAAHSPLPDLHDEDLGSTALAALLLREVAILQRLSVRFPDPERDDRWLQVERERLVDLLERQFFDAASGRFLDRYRGGDSVRRAHLGGLWAAGCPEVPFLPRDRHLREMESAGEFAFREGFRAWQAWPDDPAPPPVPAALQWFSLHALEADPDTTRRRSVLTGMRAHLLALARAGTPPGEDLTGPAGAAWTPRTSALLLFVVQESAGAADYRPLSPGMRWLEGHRLTIGLGTAAFLALLLGGWILSATFRPDRSTARLTAAAGLAKNRYAQGDLDEAMRMYRELVKEAPAGELAGEFHYHLGNCHFQRQEWTEAEKHYREAARLRPKHPEPVWNLAQALQRQGRLEEALREIGRVATEFGESHPALKRRAGDATEVIRIQMDLPARRNR